MPVQGLVYIKDNGDIIQVYADEITDSIRARLDDKNITFEEIYEVVLCYNDILRDMGINEHYRNIH